MRNIAFWDRSLRVLFGVFLLSWAIAGGPFWAYIGLFFLATGSWGNCPIYWVFRFQS